MLSVNEKNIYLYKQRQRDLLIFFDEFCDEMMKMLKMNKKEFDEYYAKNYDRLIPYQYYIENTVLFLQTIYTMTSPALKKRKQILLL